MAQPKITCAPTLGQKIIEEVSARGMVDIEDEGDGSITFVWNANAAEQLDALIREHMIAAKYAPRS